ncbi:MAG: Verrucomicrobia phage, partial [Pseudomonadota bacterium]
MNRIVCWFSCGAASAVATKLAITENAGRRPIVVAYTEVVNEHPDNKRFLKDCERWFGQEIVILQNEKYQGDIMQVFRKERFISGPKGAPCTRLLKRWPRIMFEDETDTQVFGFTSEEAGRAARFSASNDYMDLSTPLIDRGMAKADCQALLWAEGIKLPAMYDLGYRNNNCIGCV